jgi:hypothetical protein
LRVDTSGQIAKFGGLMDRRNGREGNVRLINGRSKAEFTIAAGRIERWPIINASSARYGADDLEREGSEGEADGCGSAPTSKRT